MLMAHTHRSEDGCWRHKQFEEVLTNEKPIQRKKKAEQ